MRISNREYLTKWSRRHGCRQVAERFREWNGFRLRRSDPRPTLLSRARGLRSDVRFLVFAGLLRRQIARLFHLDQIEASGRKLYDLCPAGAGSYFHLEDLRADQAASRPLIHGEKVAAHPVPSVVAVRVVDANHNFHLGLSPEAGAIRWGQSRSRIEVRQA